MEIQVLVGEVNFKPFVNEIAKTRPIPEISGAAVNLVDDNSTCLPLVEEFKHLCENRPASFGGRLPFLKPLGNLQLMTLGMADDGVSLLLKGNATLSLPRSRNADVSKKLLHVLDGVLTCKGEFDLSLSILEFPFADVKALKRAYASGSARIRW